MPDLIRAEFEVLDERFALIAGDDYLERHWSGGRWTEGPAYVPAGRYVLFSDIPNDRVMRWDEATGEVGVFDHRAGHANGRTVDREGRVVTCLQGERKVVRTEHDGSTTVLVDSWDGKRLNSPNDVVVSADGAVWFTDPPYGILSDYQGHRAEQELDGWFVFRIAPDGRMDVVADDFVRPNGLAFSPDERLLYIADSRRKHIRVFDVDGGRLTGGAVFAEIEPGNPDGVRVDADGRVWVAARDGLQVHDPDGTLIGKLRMPEPATSNLCFGGARRNVLFITSTAGLYSIRLNINGCKTI